VRFLILTMQVEAISAFLLTVVVATFVAWPFFVRPAENPEAGTPEAQLTPLERQKLEAYAAIKEAEFDHQMGKLNDADFAVLRERYSRQALAAIAAIETSQAGAQRIGQRAEGRLPSRIAFCPTCGRGLPPRASFCPGCGIALRPLKEAVA
jgi:zinc-ribbon domain